MKSQVPGIEYLTQEQLKLLFSTPDITLRFGRRDRFFMILAYETGCRIQELLDIKLRSIIHDKDRVKIIVNGKGNKTRQIPLISDTIIHLNTYLNEFHKGNDSDQYLFYTIHNGTHTQMHSGTVDFFLKKYGKTAKELQPDFPENLHAHMLRHSIAMAMYKKGIPISYIRDFLGHSSVETTAIYSYADEETIANALESVDVPITGDVKKATKNWKGKEQYLIEFCGLE
jgi:site-specific recombinase XerD